jgi:hypothetical protein
MSFDLQDFLERAQRYAHEQDRSLATVSKRLFSTARTLPGMVDGEVSPRLETLIDADKKLRALMTEGAASHAA